MSDITLKLRTKTEMSEELVAVLLADIETALRVFYARGYGLAPPYAISPLLDAAAKARSDHRRETDLRKESEE